MLCFHCLLSLPPGRSILQAGVGRWLEGLLGFSGGCLGHAVFAECSEAEGRGMSLVSPMGCSFGRWLGIHSAMWCHGSLRHSVQRLMLLLGVAPGAGVG